MLGLPGEAVSYCQLTGFCKSTKFPLAINFHHFSACLESFTTVVNRQLKKLVGSVKDPLEIHLQGSLVLSMSFFICVIGIQ